MTAVLRFFKIAYGSIASKPATIAPPIPPPVSNNWQWNDGESIQWNDNEFMEIS